MVHEYTGDVGLIDMPSKGIVLELNSTREESTSLKYFRKCFRRSKDMKRIERFPLRKPC